MKVPPFEADVARPKPYLWVSWITRLLAGEDHCWWKVWYKAHYKYEKRPNDPERADFFKEWTAKHDKMVTTRAEELVSSGYEVMVEEHADFKLTGKNSDLSGKPDIVGIKAPEAVIIDAKAGRRRDSDHWQVLVYHFALKLTWLKTIPPGVEPQIRGEVQYQDGVTAVRPLGPVEREHLLKGIRIVVDSEVPEAAPSPSECRYCDIAKCPVRFSGKDHRGDAKGLF